MYADFQGWFLATEKQKETEEGVTFVDHSQLEMLFTAQNVTSLHSRKSIVVTKLSFARMPSRQYRLSMNKLHCYN